MKIFWTKTSEVTYAEKIEFIRKKWNEEQVDTFIDLVGNYITTLKSGVLIGRLYKIKNLRISFISKQTTFVYRIFEKESRVDLLLWNNKKNQQEFKKFIK
ncbi:MAG: hypothetical protein ACTIJ9_02360 [Aequorivita sp.]